MARELATWDVEKDDRSAGEITARDVHLDRRRTWDRREFLSRGLFVLEARAGTSLVPRPSKLAD